MKDLKKFNIEIYKLSNARHEYDFEVDDSFFQYFENSPVEKGKVSVHVVLDKRETFIEANFNFEGSLELTCDRSLELFDFPVNFDDKLIYKYGEEEMEVDDEIIIITKTTQRINVAQFIYESVSLSIPYKKLHPKFQNEEGEDEEGVMVYQDGGDEFEEDPENEAENTDPRWDILKNLKNN